MLIRPCACILAGTTAMLTACAQTPSAPTINGAYHVQVEAQPPAGTSPPLVPPLQPCAPPAETVGLTFEAQIENQLLDMINELRERANVPALTKDEANLRGAARERVVERSDSLFGPRIEARLARWCVPFRTSTQFALRFPSETYPASDLITFLMNVPTAMAAFVNPDYNRIGIAVYRGGPDHRLYAALLFVGTP
jgi:uncharacterized protein YkwD